jgi:glycoside/pentoside/hexuronide:cation symporter, GPH family
MTDVTPAGSGRRLTMRQKLAYASGQAGNVLGYQLISTFILPLYTPPEGKGPNLVPGFILIFGTIFVLNLLSRGIDTFFDPFIANLSDRSAHRLGRRRFFMLVSCAPLALFTGLIFFPPFGADSWANVVFLGVTMTVYFCLFSTYVAPYLALLPEIAPDKNENTTVSTMMAGAALFGAMLVSVVAPLFLDADDPGRSSLKLMAGALAAVSFVFLVIPVIFVDERRLTARKEGEAASHLGLIASLKETFSDRAFVPYVFGSTLFFVGFTVVQTAAPNFVEVLLQKPLKDLGLVIGPLFGVAALSFFAVGRLQRTFGKRRLMIGGALSLAALMGFGVPLLPSMPGLALPLFAAAGVPIALFLALPNAILADVCSANAHRTGQRREGMFFGAQGFLQKVSLGVAVGVVSWLAEAFGKAVDAPLGVQLAGPLAALALIASAACFWLYPEARVQSEADGRA